MMMRTTFPDGLTTVHSIGKFSQVTATAPASQLQTPFVRSERTRGGQHIPGSQQWVMKMSSHTAPTGFLLSSEIPSTHSSICESSSAVSKHVIVPVPSDDITQYRPLAWTSVVIKVLKDWFLFSVHHWKRTGPF